MGNELVNRVAVVTGAGAGIGRAVAVAFAEAGASVIVNDADHDSAEQTRRQIKSTGGTSEVCAAAVGGEDAAQALVAAAVDGFGDLDILVNCAGIVRDRMIQNMTVDEFDEVLRVHLRGSWCNCREAVRHWRPAAKRQVDEWPEPAARRYRKIINVSSLSGLRGNAGQTNYAAAKAGIVGLTKALAKEVGRLSISVNAVAPVARTAMTSGNDLGLHLPAGPKREQYLRNRLERSALRWIGEPDAVSPAFLFLASPASDYLSGQVLNVDGGANV